MCNLLHLHILKCTISLANNELLTVVANDTITSIQEGRNNFLVICDEDVSEKTAYII